MQFGITIKPDMSVRRMVALTRQAEEAGFEYGWIFDSHVLWLEPYPLLTLMAAKEQKTRVPLSDVEELKESKASLMPENVLKQLKPQELRDLFGFLESVP